MVTQWRRWSLLHSTAKPVTNTLLGCCVQHTKAHNTDGRHCFKFGLKEQAPLTSDTSAYLIMGGVRGAGGDLVVVHVLPFTDSGCWVPIKAKAVGLQRNTRSVTSQSESIPLTKRSREVDGLSPHDWQHVNIAKCSGSLPVVPCTLHLIM